MEARSPSREEGTRLWRARVGGRQATAAGEAHLVADISSLVELTLLSIAPTSSSYETSIHFMPASIHCLGQSDAAAEHAAGR